MPAAGTSRDSLMMLAEPGSLSGTGSYVDEDGEELTKSDRFGKRVVVLGHSDSMKQAIGSNR